MRLLGFGILKGMAVTLENFVRSYFDRDRRHHLFTKEYAWEPGAPAEVLPARADTTVTAHSRNFPILLHDGADPMGGIRCVACQICERECPPQCIYIEKDYDEQGKYIKRPAIFDIDLSVCMSCQICVEVCPFDAIVMDSQFELSTANRFGGLLQHRDQLLKSNEYYHRIHPEEARARDDRMAQEKAEKEAKQAAADAAKKKAAEAKAAAEIAAEKSKPEPSAPTAGGAA